MPLFSNRFSHKKYPIRKFKPLSSLHRELNQSVDQNSGSDVIKLQLDENLITFDQKVGQWVTSDKSLDQNHKIKDFESMNKLILEENRLLKVKNEILLQMVRHLFQLYICFN